MRFIISLILISFSMPSFTEESAVDERFIEEQQLQTVGFSITPHKPTYLIPFSFNDKIQSYDAYPKDENGSNDLQQLELEFQISFKIPVVVDIADLPLSLYFAYTQVSFWQAYNSELSAPFRETNYEPEMFFRWQQHYDIGLGWEFKLATFGFTHQSNGRSSELSRGWNRLNGNVVIANGNLAVDFTPWYRFEQSASRDDNPDLLDYYGHGKITLAYKLNNHKFSFMSRNNLESGFSKGAMAATWSFPIHNKIHGYLKVFSGYGNSMIEYDEYTNTIGIGISLTDWL
ncbi:hypothetical protein GCM10007916_16240 [Psychromonas marina]|uniref:Phospholipase A1 n=1 Tax=Psychromonas marina TaxID=88364 RepID=A0ABQ6DZR6_9GAMM|nr:phospholipase A [Psychromonas marina]GLS90557.1 hypothetical protein GCM10007916_16240 [Psychromonas marina]